MPASTAAPLVSAKAVEPTDKKKRAHELPEAVRKRRKKAPVTTGLLIY